MNRICDYTKNKSELNCRNMETPQWEPTWYTTKDFAEAKPINLLHKEMIKNELKVECSGNGAEGTQIPAYRNMHILARSSFMAVKGEEYLIRISGDDYFKLYINGKYVMQGPAPAYTDHYYFNEADITEYLCQGRNTVAVHLYYQGLVNRVWNSGDNRCALAAEIFESNGNSVSMMPWKYRRTTAFTGDTTGYETQFLEDFDSRVWDEDWNMPGFQDEGWDKMVKAGWADYKLFPCPVKNLQIYERQPEKTEPLQDGSLMVDMGEEITGALCLEAEGKKGDEIFIFCGEELNMAGDVRFQMRCNCCYKEKWTLSEGTCRLEPFDYKAFRYARISPAKGVRIKKVWAWVRHYPMDKINCRISSSNQVLVKIFQICKNAVMYGTQEGYLDCPAREKGQYLGDAIVTSHAQAWLSGSTEMMKKCIDQFARTAKICPGLMAVAPGGLMQEIADFSLLWTQMLLNCYNLTGEKEILKKYYETARGIIRHFSQFARQDGLLCQVSDKWNLVDWPENLRDGYDFLLSRPVVAYGCHNVVNTLYLGAKKMLDEIEQTIGLSQSEESRWKELLPAYYRAFYRQDKHLLADSEESGHCSLHANVYALYFQILPLGEEEAVCNFLEEKGFECGVLTSYFVLKGLAKAGKYKAVYELLVNKSEHGWVNMIEEGATCCFEAWGKDQKWNTSLCHPWASAPVPVIIEDIAGIRPAPELEEGYYFDPHIPEEVEEFTLHASIRGRRAAVRKKSGNVWLEIV